MAYGFYLFSIKYSFSFLKSISERSEFSTILMRVNEMLDESNEFHFISNGSKNFLIADGNDTLEFARNKIKLKDIYQTENFEDYLFTLELEDGDEAVIQNGILVRKPVFFDSNKGIYSCNMRSIELQIMFSGNTLKTKFNNVGKAVRLVENLQLYDE